MVPGAAGWVHAKASGVRQLVETVLKTAPKRITSALESDIASCLRKKPARDAIRQESPAACVCVYSASMPAMKPTRGRKRFF